MYKITFNTTDAALLASVVGQKEADTVLRIFPTLGAIARAGYDGLVLVGIKPKTAQKIMFALELGNRATVQAIEENGSLQNVTGSTSVARYMQDKIGASQVEELHVLFLNRSNNIVACEKTSQGGITGTVADPRVILSRALATKAVGLILCHNHPSGNLRPSRADEELTIKIREAARFFDIKVLDHVIVSQQGYYSFADEGCI
jgi:DNA repair protein RadC